MTKKTATPINLITALHEQTAILLNNEGIYSVLGYAWEGEDEPSSEYIGLAMWSLDAPFKPSWALWERTTSPKNPTQQDETFYKSGEDFIGTMEMAKHAIGLALYSFGHREPDNIMDHDENFWEQCGVAAVWLNAASDRIRDYFVMARYGMTSHEYKKGGTGRKNYTHPFITSDPHETPNAKEAAEQLTKDVKDLDRRRTSRNKIIHDVASKQGRNAVASIKMQREAATKSPYIGRSVSDALRHAKSWEVTARALNAERTKELQSAISDLKEWYLLLIHACGLVIEYEYWRRIKK